MTSLKQKIQDVFTNWENKRLPDIEACMIGRIAIDKLKSKLLRLVGEHVIVSRKQLQHFLDMVCYNCGRKKDCQDTLGVVVIHCDAYNKLKSCLVK